MRRLEEAAARRESELGGGEKLREHERQQAHRETGDIGSDEKTRKTGTHINIDMHRDVVEWRIL